MAFGVPEVVHEVHRLLREYPDRNAVRKYAEGFDWDATTLGQMRLFTGILEASA